VGIRILVKIKSQKAKAINYTRNLHHRAEANEDDSFRQLAEVSIESKRLARGDAVLRASRNRAPFILIRLWYHRFQAGEAACSDEKILA
jgi:hypothetical protein